jgi:dipeptidyl aminopeptidase/acylaminoacyl peptidase
MCIEQAGVHRADRVFAGSPLPWLCGRGATASWVRFTVCFQFVILVIANSLAQPLGRPAPLSIDALRATRFNASLRYVRKLDDGPNFTAYLVSYRSSQLLVYAMVAVPKSPPPPRGFPVLVANHGTHPDPPRYGFGTDGIDSRPGDYYRSVPELYAKNGFLVVMPDYRGHNASEGLQYSRGFLASAYFTEDVLALLSGLHDLGRADLRNVFMWGHSLGGEVTLRALLATDAVKGASLWSSVGGDIWEQAYHYSRYKDREAVDGSDVEKARVSELRQQIADLGVSYDWAAREPLRYLRLLRTPVILHHATGDPNAEYEWSERLAQELYMAGARYLFYSYPGADHLLQGQLRDQAVARDVEFFRSLEREDPAAPR